MTSHDRVAAALAFREVDRLPRFIDAFWPEFLERWDQLHPGVPPAQFAGNDLSVIAADETAWPTRAGLIRDEGRQSVHRTGWGVIEQRTHGLPFATSLGVTVAEREDPDQLAFDDPELDCRYDSAHDVLGSLAPDLFLVAKTGGPYLRAATMRGQQDFWIDIAEDPGWVTAYVDRVASHITAVGVASLRRFGLHAIAIYDDVATNRGPFISPATYERICLPALRRMVAAYRQAGATTIFHHSDGNVLPLLDFWVDAGIDAIHPVEYRAGMDPVAIRERYGRRLACLGGMDNAIILPRGDGREIDDHLHHLVAAGADGGYIIGPHSIGPDISPETFAYVIEWLDTHAPGTPR